MRENDGFVSIIGDIEMKQYQLQAISEHAGISHKIEELDEFMESDDFNDVPEEEQELILKQFWKMEAYSLLLYERMMLYGRDR